MLTNCGITRGILAFMFLGLCAPVATAQSVRGHGKLTSGGSVGAEITVDAWEGGDGNPYGYVVWTGPIAPADAWGSSQRLLLDVSDVSFDGDTAYVVGVISLSPFPYEIGHSVYFIFTDNSGTDEPDEITVIGWGDVHFSPIMVGNFTVTD